MARQGGPNVQTWFPGFKSDRSSLCIYPII
ncbi:hypothetical protein CMEL01_07547 [Colletotrichum melonis]|uniref:Uncharacterized protein n=2 Tax=Colletotrichum acutatum species complex TaxID=2707335 RepID=A0AAI9XJJ9_9PEZI|nr:uncharacterized protein CTAM01_11861 [Colletotrichum tamarilloi]KAK1450211.1 hypothetical protein CMEL01_07547 [Colletotrichum melonis]KAK1487404.1 hypothetical protein CTAM01_11861 [Colletotrichum tamarilloi]